MKNRIQLDRLLVRVDFEVPFLPALEQQSVFARQFVGLGPVLEVTLLVEHGDHAGRHDIDPSSHDAVIPERNARAGKRADEGTIAYFDDHLAPTGHRALDGRCATKIGLVADDDALAHPTFDHRFSEGARVEVDEARRHDGGALANVGAEAYPSAVGNADTRRHHVVGHVRKFVHAVDAERIPVEPSTEYACIDLADRNRTLGGPRDVR